MNENSEGTEPIKSLDFNHSVTGEWTIVPKESDWTEEEKWLSP